LVDQDSYVDAAGILAENMGLFKYRRDRSSTRRDLSELLHELDSKLPDPAWFHKVLQIGNLDSNVYYGDLSQHPPLESSTPNLFQYLVETSD
jgi:hypothetical protein